MEVECQTVCFRFPAVVLRGLSDKIRWTPWERHSSRQARDGRPSHKAHPTAPEDSGLFQCPSVATCTPQEGGTSDEARSLRSLVLKNRSVGSRLSDGTAVAHAEMDVPNNQHLVALAPGWTLPRVTPYREGRSAQGVRRRKRQKPHNEQRRCPTALDSSGQTQSSHSYPMGNRTGSSC